MPVNKDEFWVNYPKLHKDEAKHGGLIIYKDTSYKPEWNLILHGEIVSLPNGFSGRYKDLEGIIQLGDKVYFNYLCADESCMYEGLLKVPVESVFCYIRDGKINMFGGHVFCVAKWDEHEEVEVEGKIIKAKMSGNLVTGLDIKYDKRQTYIAHIGENTDISVGDLVVMERHCDQKYEIEGKEYFVMHEENVLCKIDQ